MDDYRRRLLGRAASALPAVLIVSLLPAGRKANAGNATKAEFHYQDHPNEGKRCAGCAAYQPPADGRAQGSCTIVAGPVSADGWCMAFTPKQAGPD